MVPRARCLLATILMLFAVGPASADGLLPSRDLRFPPFAIAGTTDENFDIFDVRQEIEHPPRIVAETAGRSLFVKKRHVGIAMGDDNGILHTSFGFYWTVAEWKRFNFGLPAVEIGFGRYLESDASSGRLTRKDKPTLILSLASIHYRLGSIRAFGLTCYLNFEQTHDLREDFVGSQFGVSFSKN